MSKMLSQLVKRYERYRKRKNRSIEHKAQIPKTIKRDKLRNSTPVP